MKKLILLLTALTMVLTLCACTQTPPETDPTATVPETTVQTEPTEPPAVFADYEYRWEEGRDRDWEEDILYLAKAYLGELVPSLHHPLLANREVQDEGYAHGDIIVDLGCFYDPAVREAFCAEIQNLLDHVPELRDAEIIFGMKKAVALLSDLHSWVMLPENLYFPLSLQPIQEEEHAGVYVSRIPSEYAEWLNAQLVAVGGIPVEQLVDTLRPYISRETEYAVNRNLFSHNDERLFTQLWTLQFAGAVDWDSTEGDFTLRNASGEEKTIRLQAMSTDARMACDTVGNDFLNKTLLRNPEKIYFWEHYPQEKALYIRIKFNMEQADYPVAAMTAQLQEQLASAPETEKVIVDVRGNPGGHVDPFTKEFLEFLKNLGSRDVYVLIDNDSTSGAVLLPAVICQEVEGAKLVGTPAKQPVRFFAGWDHETPNNKVWFMVSRQHFDYWKDYGDGPLMPDIPVDQTLEDYVNGVDTVLETVLHMEQEVNP